MKPFLMVTGFLAAILIIAQLRDGTIDRQRTGVVAEGPSALPGT